MAVFYCTVPPPRFCCTVGHKLAVAPPCTTPSQINRGSKKELALEGHWEKSRALVMRYTGADERYGSKLSRFIAYGCVWCRSGLYLHVPDCRSKWLFLRSGLFVLNFWLHLALWIYCTHHKLSRTGLEVVEADLHPAMSRIVAQSELNFSSLKAEFNVYQRPTATTEVATCTSCFVF